jgi:hypothetical protein
MLYEELELKVRNLEKELAEIRLKREQDLREQDRKNEVFRTAINQIARSSAPPEAKKFDFGQALNDLLGKKSES